MTQEILGNTILKSKPLSSIKCRKWCFTLNNYTDIEEEEIKNYLISNATKYIYGFEGEEKTKHLQGFIEFKEPVRFTALQKINKRWHLEKTKGTMKQNYDYCIKECKFVTNIELDDFLSLEERLLKDEYENVIWKDWQQDIINIIEDIPDKRKVYWYWDGIGNVGKSFLCKYIALKYDVILCNGKTNDIFHQVNLWRQKNKNELQIPPCLIDVARSDFHHVNYSAIEQLKNGFLYSGKYEGGKVLGKSPHVIVFSNYETDVSQLSLDRLVVRELV